MRIGVIGGGHGCYAAAADLAEKGHQVRLWRRDGAAFDGLRRDGALEVTDYRGTRRIALGDAPGRIALAADLASATEDAALLVIPLPSTTHAALAPELAPHLRDGQVVFLPPGTFGSYLFARALKDAGNRAEVAFAETGTLPYLARKHGDRVVISAYATRLPTGVFPRRLAGPAFETLARAYPSVEPIEDALSGALMNAGPVIQDRKSVV